MFKGFLTAFIIVILLMGLLLYAYGKKMMSNMTGAKTEAYVDRTTEVSSINHWVDYTPPSKKFSAKFPTSPQHATDRLTDTKTKEHKHYEMFISESNGKVFMISVISFINTDQLKDEEAILKSIIDDMVSSNPSNKLENIQYGSYQGLKDADFLITNNSYAITGLAFINKNQLYVISSLSKTPTETKNDFEYFVKSFNLNKESLEKESHPIEK